MEQHPCRHYCRYCPFFATPAVGPDRTGPDRNAQTPLLGFALVRRGIRPSAFVAVLPYAQLPLVGRPVGVAYRSTLLVAACRTGNPPAAWDDRRELFSAPADALHFRTPRDSRPIQAFEKKRGRGRAGPDPRPVQVTELWACTSLSSRRRVDWLVRPCPVAAAEGGGRHRHRHGRRRYCYCCCCCCVYSFEFVPKVNVPHCALLAMAGTIGWKENAQRMADPNCTFGWWRHATENFLGEKCRDSHTKRGPARGLI
jgi:hypothetical protein